MAAGQMSMEVLGMEGTCGQMWLEEEATVAVLWLAVADFCTLGTSPFLA